MAQTAPGLKASLFDLAKDQYLAIWALESLVHHTTAYAMAYNKLAFDRNQTKKRFEKRLKEIAKILIPRPNIHKLLKRLTDQYNFVHVVHSSYVCDEQINQRIIEVGDLSDYIKMTLPIVTITQGYTNGYASPYRFIVEQLGLSSQEASKRSLIIGQDYNCPLYRLPKLYDPQRVVFLEERYFSDIPKGSSTNIVGEIIDRLIQLGEGNLYQGHQNLYKSSRSPLDPQHITTTKFFTLSGGYSIMLNYIPFEDDNGEGLPSPAHIPYIWT